MNYELYTMLLSKIIHGTVTAEEMRQVEKYEASRPHSTCCRCHQQLRSYGRPHRITHDDSKCKPKLRFDNGVKP